MVQFGECSMLCAGNFGSMATMIGGEEVELLNDRNYQKIRQMYGVDLSHLTPELFQVSLLLHF